MSGPGKAQRRWRGLAAVAALVVFSTAGGLAYRSHARAKAEVAAVNKRLKAMGGLRPPLPAGVDPNRVRMDRKAMRGR